MLAHINLDMDVLRTFVTGFELGSFARAADRLGRSQSAVSAQLRKLEEQVGQPLVRKAGRGLVPTEAGEVLLSYAHRILDLNDEAVASIAGATMEGSVRLGLPQDFAESWLPQVLARFARAHPRVRIDVRVERNALLLDRIVKGELDLSLAWGLGAESPHAAHIADLPIRWIGRPGWSRATLPAGEPLPLIAFESPCAFRDPGVAALDAAGIAWRLAFTSASLSGLWAAAAAGLGATIRTDAGMPSSLVTLDPVVSGLPALPSIPLSLHRAERDASGPVGLIGDILLGVVREEVARRG